MGKPAIFKPFTDVYYVSNGSLRLFLATLLAISKILNFQRTKIQIFGKFEKVSYGFFLVRQNYAFSVVTQVYFFFSAFPPMVVATLRSQKSPYLQSHGDSCSFLQITLSSCPLETFFQLQLSSVQLGRDLTDFTMRLLY